MNNILNPRVQRLIKDDLWDYAKAFGIFFAISFIVITVLVIVFSMTNIVVAIEGVDIEGVQYAASEITNFLNTSNIFNVINLFGLMIMMFISGIVAGAELPMHVRQGIARNEYFKATLIGAIIVSIIIIPLALVANSFITLISENVMVGLNGDSLLTIIMYILWLIVVYLIGYFIVMIYQRFGWMVGVLVTVVVLVMFGVISWGSGAIIVFPRFLVGESNLLGLAPELLGPALVIAATILASGVYMLVKDAPVKIK